MHAHKTGWTNNTVSGVDEQALKIAKVKQVCEAHKSEIKQGGLKQVCTYHVVSICLISVSNLLIFLIGSILVTYICMYMNERAMCDVTKCSTYTMETRHCFSKKSMKTHSHSKS